MKARSSAQSNVNIIRAWKDVHNGCDMKVLDHMDEKVKISRCPIGVAYGGLMWE